MSARRPAALVGAAAVLASGILAAAAPAHASGSSASGGSASAVTARVGLDVDLLSKANSSVDLTLNEVRAPRTSERTLLSARVNGVNKGEPVQLVRADVAKSRATTETDKNEGYANLVDVKVNVPGLPAKPVFQAKAVTSRATCEEGAKPTAESAVGGQVTVLGKTVTLNASGTTTVNATGVGRVQLELSKESTTADSAAATALILDITVKPAALGVGEVTGKVVLAEAKCQAPGSAGAASSGSDSGENAGQTAGGDTSGASAGESGGSAAAEDSGATEGSGSDQAGSPDDAKNLAETGGGATLALGGVGAALLIGGGALVYMRRRKSAAQG